MSALENKKWFFLDGDLYEFISTHRAKNELRAYNYTEHKHKVLVLSEARRYRKGAFSVSQVGEMINRSRRTVYWYIENGIYLPSGKADRPDGRGNAKWWFSEDDVIEFRDVVHEQSMRAPVQRRLPSREEVRTMVRTKNMLYVQKDGDFVPVWLADDW